VVMAQFKRVYSAPMSEYQRWRHPMGLDQPADFFGERTTVRRIYLRIFAHVNEHYGQSVAYARVNGIVPPWSQTQKPE
jgi:hypothetical protein